MESTERGQFQSNVTESVAGSSSPLIPLVHHPTPERRNTFRIGPWEFSLFWTNALFVLVVLGSSFGQTIFLPLWIDSIKDEISSAAFVDRYFMLSFASLSFFVMFGLAILFIRIFSPKDLGETERNFPHLLLFLVGLFGAFNGVLAIFASNREKTPRSLEAILGTCKIPLIILFRWVFLLSLPLSRDAWRPGHAIVTRQNSVVVLGSKLCVSGRKVVWPYSWWKIIFNHQKILVNAEISYFGADIEFLFECSTRLSRI